MSKNTLTQSASLSTAKWLSSGILLIVILSLYNLKSGAITYSWHELTNALEHPILFNTSLISINILQVRLPMVLIAILGGSGLAIAGMLLQRITKNPLACPSLLGIEYGTALSVIITNLISPQITRSSVIAIAFVGGLITYFFMQLIISKTKASMVGMTLIGVAFNTLFYSLIQAILIAFPYQAQAILYDLNGSIQGITLADIKLIVLPFAVLFTIILLLSKRLILLDLDEVQADSAGFNIKYYRLLLLLLAISITSLITSLIGPLLFFGLIIPHLVRPFLSKNNVIWMCAIFGSAFLLMAEWISRTISPQTPPPLGIVIMLMGAPILLTIVRRYFVYDDI